MFRIMPLHYSALLNIITVFWFVNTHWLGLLLGCSVKNSFKDWQGTMIFSIRIRKISKYMHLSITRSYFS